MLSSSSGKKTAGLLLVTDKIPEAGRVTGAKPSNKDLLIFVLIAFFICQVMTFVRLNNQQKNLDIQNEALLELAHTTEALFELARLQMELSKLDLKKEERESNKYQEWRLHEI